MSNIQGSAGRTVSSKFSQQVKLAIFAALGLALGFPILPSTIAEFQGIERDLGKVRGQIFSE